ncbi:hypothetical protein GCM10020229_67120 [Kitasatospora albolonga]
MGRYQGGGHRVAWDPVSHYGQSGSGKLVVYPGAAGSGPGERGRAARAWGGRPGGVARVGGLHLGLPPGGPETGGANREKIWHPASPGQTGASKLGGGQRVVSVAFRHMAAGGMRLHGSVPLIKAPGWIRVGLGVGPTVRGKPWGSGFRAEAWLLVGRRGGLGWGPSRWAGGLHHPVATVFFHARGKGSMW